MHLLLVDTNPSWGGGQKWCLSTAEGLARRGLQVTVASLAGAPLGERCREAGIPRIELARLGGGLSAALRLARWARRARPAVVISTLGRDARAGALVKLACGARLVQRRGLARPVGRNPLGRWIALRSVDCFVANCEAIRDELVHAPHGPEPARVTTILNAVEPAPAQDRARAREALGLAPGELAVLALGRLSAMKGHARLLEAWKEVEAREPRARLLFAGSGPEGPALEAQARALAAPQRVRFLGFREDAWSLLAAADLYVQPSIRDEGTSHALLEALAAGVPALVSRAGGLAETLERCGGGRVVERGDVPALARGILELLAAPGELARLSREGRAGVAAHHDPERILDEWERLVRGLARWREPLPAGTTSPEARR